MRFKELLSMSENKTNKQINLSVKKKELRKVGISMKNLLNMKIDRQLINLKGGRNGI